MPKNDPLQRRKKVIKSSAFNVIMNRYNVKVVSDPTPMGKETLERLADPMGKHIFPGRDGRPANTKNYVALQNHPTHPKRSKPVSKKQTVNLPKASNPNPKPSGTFFLTEANNNDTEDLLAPGLEMGMDMLRQMENKTLVNNYINPQRKLPPVHNQLQRQQQDQRKKYINDTLFLNQQSNKISKLKQKFDDIQNNSRRYRNETKSANGSNGRISKLKNKSNAKRNKTAPQLNRKDRLMAIRPDRQTRISSIIKNNNNNNMKKGNNNKHLSDKILSPIKENGWITNNNNHDPMNNELESSLHTTSSPQPQTSPNNNNNDDTDPTHITTNKSDQKSWSKTLLKLRGGNKKVESEIMLNFVGLKNKSIQERYLESIPKGSPLPTYSELFPEEIAHEMSCFDMNNNNNTNTVMDDILGNDNKQRLSIDNGNENENENHHHNKDRIPVNVRIADIEKSSPQEKRKVLIADSPPSTALERKKLSSKSKIDLRSRLPPLN